MMKRSFTSAALAFIALCSSFIYAQVATEDIAKPVTPKIGPGPTAQERLDRECSGAIRFFHVCRISFARLSARPELYHGRVIGLVGFLAVDDGELAIYASEGDYERGVDGASVSVLVPDPDDAKWIQEKLYGHVSVNGHFDASAFTPEKPRLGRVTAIWGLGTVTRRPQRERELYIEIDPDEIAEDEDSQRKDH